MAELNIDGVVGNPVNPYLQQYSDTCAVKSQQIILHEFGLDMSEDQLAQIALDNGWFNGGTPPEHVGKLIAGAGIPVTLRDNANIYDLAEQLANGHKIIVGVDASELYNGGIWEWIKEIFMGPQPDHALIVAGIDNTDPANPMVILTDPGTGDVCKPYPLDTFMDAWRDSNCFMMSTDIPTPASIENFEAAGIADMHLPAVAGVPYVDFLDFQAYSHQIDPSQLPMLNDIFFNMPQTSNFDFNMEVANAGLPQWDMNLYPPTPVLWNPWDYNYADFGFGDTGIIDIDPVSSPIDQHRLDTLNQLHSEALEHAQQCMNDGMYISATMWQNQANDLQSDINDMISGS